MNQSVKDAISRMEPTSKAAKLRQLMPEIEEKLAAGVKLGAIHQTLLATGFDLPFQTLKTYLYRCRRKACMPSLADNSVQRQGTLRDISPKNWSAEYNENISDRQNLRSPLSMQEVGRLINPDPTQQAEKLAHYEKMARQQRRNSA